MTLTFEFDLDNIKANKHAKYGSEVTQFKSFCPDTQTATNTYTHYHIVNVLTSNITFFDFCCFSCVM